MRVVTTTLLLAAFVAGAGTTASAQMMERSDRMMSDGMRMERSGRMMDDGMRMQRQSGSTMERRSMREPTVTGSTRRGASTYAPGQVKKRMNATSARSYAPGRMMMDDDMSGGMRRR